MSSLQIIDDFLLSVLSVSPGSDSADALVSWFCDKWPHSVYKLTKLRSRANTAYGSSTFGKSTVSDCNSMTTMSS